MDTAAERIFGFVRGATREHIPCGSVTEERQSTKAKRPQPEGFHQKPGGGFVAPQSKTHEGYSPSSRLAGARFLMKRRYPEFF
jgi:hypothetical protein